MKMGHEAGERVTISAEDAYQGRIVTILHNDGGTGIGYVVDGNAYCSLGDGRYALASEMPRGIERVIWDAGQRYNQEAWSQ